MFGWRNFGGRQALLFVISFELKWQPTTLNLLLLLLYHEQVKFRRGALVVGRLFA